MDSDAEITVRRLADYILPELIIPQVQSTSAAEVIAELCSALGREHKLSDSGTFYETVMARERLGSTCFSPGWAIPHGRVNGLGQLSFAFGRSSQPMRWFDSGLQVQAIFLFVVPEAEAKTYLELIATLARLNQNSALLNQLLAARDQEGLFRIFDQSVMRSSERPVCATTRPD